MHQFEDHYVGQFRFGKKSLLGRVRLNGADSQLEVYSNVELGRTRTIRGVSQSGEKVTLCNVVQRGWQSSTSDRRYRSWFFPHYIAVGDRYLDSDAKIISAISFTTNGARNLFNDFESFGMAKVENIEGILPARAKKDRRAVKHSAVFYCVIPIRVTALGQNNRLNRVRY